jgi:hypothetical protein
MFTQTIADSPQNRRGGGRVSYLLFAPGQFGSTNLAITWVEAGPGGYGTVNTPVRTPETIRSVTRPRFPHRQVAGTDEF